LRSPKRRKAQNNIIRLAFEKDRQYLATSASRFIESNSEKEIKNIFNLLTTANTYKVNLMPQTKIELYNVGSPLKKVLI